MQSPRALVRRLLVSAAPVAALSALAPAAHAATTTITLVGPAAQSLSAHDVRVRAVAPATERSGRIALPTSGDVVAGRAIAHRGALALRAGARSITLRDLRVGPGARPTLSALVAGRRTALAVVGTSTRKARPLTLTAAGAAALRRELGRTGLVAGRLGTIALPAPAAGRAIVGGQVAWGFAAAVRGAFTATGANYNTGEPFRLLSGGATQLPDDTFGFPVTGGAYDRASGRATVTTKGTLRLGYQVHGAPDDGIAHGIWVTLGDLTVAIDGTHGTLSGVTDGGFHGSPPIPTQRRVFADLDLSAAPAVVAPDGATVTWTGVRATLNAVGDPLGLGQYHAGYALDPLTITARLGAADSRQEKR